MAKGRMVSVKAGQDPDLNSMSVEAELVFLLTVPHLDRDGLITGDPIPLWACVAPRRVELMDKMPRIIGEWIERGLVVRYEWKDGAILFFPGFRKHNQNLPYEREPVSDFPPPPGYYRDAKGRGLIPENPDLAGHLASNFDARSNYHLALREASQPLQKQPSRKHPEKIGKSSGRVPEEIGTEHQDQDQHQAEVEGECNNNMRAFARAEAELVDGFVGVDVVFQKLSDDEILCLAGWLWLYNGLHERDPYAQHDFARCYKRNPFEGIDNPVGYMLRQATKGISPPLAARHKQDFAAALHDPGFSAIGAENPGKHDPLGEGG